MEAQGWTEELIKERKLRRSPFRPNHATVAGKHRAEASFPVAEFARELRD